MDQFGGPNCGRNRRRPEGQNSILRFVMTNTDPEKHVAFRTISEPCQKIRTLFLKKRLRKNPRNCQSAAEFLAWRPNRIKSQGQSGSWGGLSRAALLGEPAATVGETIVCSNDPARYCYTTRAGFLGIPGARASRGVSEAYTTSSCCGCAATFCRTRVGNAGIAAGKAGRSKSPHASGRGG